MSTFYAEKDRWPLWAPVFFGVGISFYFSLKSEPFICIVWVLPCLGYLIFLWRKNIFSWFPFWGSVFLFLLGIAIPTTRTFILKTPMLEQAFSDVPLIATINCIESMASSEGRKRLTLNQLDFCGPLLFPLPQKIRLTLSCASGVPLEVGGRVYILADLLPFSEPATLGGYDFRREAYFRGIGAIGCLKKFFYVQEAPKRSLSQWVDFCRFKLIRLINQKFSSPSFHKQVGPIVSALITGDRSAISPSTRQAFVDSGLAHVLAISGLHLSLIAGLVFLCLRRGFSLIPFSACRYPVKKWAAVIVMIVTFLYLALSGFAIPGRRAFIMIFLTMSAILLDRKPFSMRLVSFSAFLILFLEPEALLSASFQLSFSAVIALIAAYEDKTLFFDLYRKESERETRNFLGQTIQSLKKFFGSILLTTVVATLATTPFTVFLFHRLTLQAISGNLLAIPLVGLYIMPLAFLCILSIPFGACSGVWSLLGIGVEYLIKIAETVSLFPGASLFLSGTSSFYLACVVLGGLWICLWKQSWRFLGIFPIMIGFFSLIYHPLPNIFVAGDGSAIGFYKNTGKNSEKELIVSHSKRGRFYVEFWMRALGVTEKVLWTTKPYKIFLEKDCRSLLSREFFLKKIPLYLCRRNWNIVVTTGYCPYAFSSTLLIDRAALKRDGNHYIWIQKDKIYCQTGRSYQGDRPWTKKYLSVDG